MNTSNIMGIRTKLIILSVISLVGMIISLLLFMKSIDNNLYKERQDQTQKLIESSLGVIQYFRYLEVEGEMGSEEAQRLAMEALSSARFGDTGYFWINNTSGVMLMNPSAPDLEGTSVLNTVDVNGKYLFREFIETAKGGGGWVDYYWPRPGSSKAVRKISHVALFKPWGWVLGTGIYLDDMEKEITGAAINGVVMIAIIFLFLLLTSMVLSNIFLRQLKNVAIHDPLTALFTRRFLHESVPIFLSRHDRHTDQFLAVSFLDIDHFKSVNDKFGHSCGDMVLQAIGNIIKSTIRKGDLGVRYGGEELVIIMLCNEKDDATKMTERVRALSGEEKFRCEGSSFSITLSAGVSFRNEGEEFDDVLKRADENMYKAKNSGRNRLVSD